MVMHAIIGAMKNFIPLLVLTLWLGSACLATTLQDNQIANWSFRAIADNECGYKLSVDDKVLFKGKPAAFLQSSKPHQDIARFYAAPFQDFRADEYRGKRVEFTASLKLDQVEGVSGLWFKATGNDKVVAFDNMEERAPSGTADWKKYSVVLDVPADAQILTIGVYITGGGRVWFADLALHQSPEGAVARSKEWDAKKYWRFANELRKAPANMEFTETLPDAEQLLNWSVHTSKSPSKVGIDRSMLFHGRPSAFIEQQAKNPTDFASSFQDISAANYVGKRVSLNGYLKTEGVTDWTALWMRIDSGKSVLAFDNMQDRPIRGDTEWTHHAVVLDVPANATRIRLGFMLAGSGKSWLNGAKLEIVDKSVPVTAKPGAETPIPADRHNMRPDLEFKKE